MADLEYYRNKFEEYVRINKLRIDLASEYLGNEFVRYTSKSTSDIFYGFARGYKCGYDQAHF